ncbi:DUF2934 domain-containing protein [Caballeronia calidae]|uniref:DUF2934 domain-containing protein n=1 Tax=Caballeronia calidae TaxID=1777139 RepID=UPI0009408E60
MRKEFRDFVPEEQIRSLAYRLWEEAGNPEGCSDEFWILAQNRLTSDTGDGRQEHATR